MGWWKSRGVTYLNNYTNKNKTIIDGKFLGLSARPSDRIQIGGSLLVNLHTTGK